VSDQQYCCTHFFAECDFNTDGRDGGGRKSQKDPKFARNSNGATGEKRSDPVKARGRDKVWFIIQALILIGCVAVYFLVGFQAGPAAPGKCRCRRANSTRHSADCDRPGHRASYFYLCAGPDRGLVHSFHPSACDCIWSSRLLSR